MLFILFAASAFRKLSSIYVFSYFPFCFEGRIWDLIVSVPDHCLSFYFGDNELLKFESRNGSWYCTNCKDDCGLCNGAVLKDHKVDQCDNCEMWVHKGCSFITES